MIERVRFGGIVHDIGKIGVPDAILRKPGWLTDEEWDELQRHPEIAARILRGANFEDVSGWVHAHHERLDGSGYPRGLAGGADPARGPHPGRRRRLRGDALRPRLPPGADRRAPRAPSSSAARARQFDERVVATFIALLDGGLVEHEDAADGADVLEAQR